MLLAEFYRTTADLCKVGCAADAASFIRNSQSLLAVCAEFAEQATNGAWGHLEFLGDLRGGLPSQGSIPNGFPNS
jgi:hypothetical protein